MALSPLGLSNANWRAGDGTLIYEKVQVYFRPPDDTLYVRDRSAATLLTLHGIVSSERYTADSYQVVTGDGSEYLVEILRTGGCGCGK